MKRNARPSLFFVTLPKSGTVFTWESLSRVTGLAMPNLSENARQWDEYAAGVDYRHETIYASGDFFTQRLLPDRLGLYLPDGFVFGAHMPASFHNMRALETAGVRRLTLLLRDPRDATVSWAHHLKGYGPSHRSYQSKIYSLPSDFFGSSFGDQLSYHVRTFLPMAVNWIESWLEYYADPKRPIDILIVYFDELKSNPRAYIKKILDFHGLGDASLDSISPPEPGKRHFRRGEHAEWLDVFDDQDKRFAELLIGERLAQAFRKAALSHPCFAHGASNLQAGRYQEAGTDFLSVLEQFPHCREALEGLVDACRALGRDLTSIASGLDAATGTDPGPLFLYEASLFAQLQGAMTSGRGSRA